MKIEKESDQLSPIIQFKIITINGYKKYIGSFDKNTKIFRKEINNSHKFMKAQSLGIDAGLLDHLNELKCEKIRLVEKGIKVWDIDYDKFITKGWQYPRDCNTKAQSRFQPSYIAHEKWWDQLSSDGELIKKGLEKDDAYDKIKESKKEVANDNPNQQLSFN